MHSTIARPPCTLCRYSIACFAVYIQQILLQYARPFAGSPWSVVPILSKKSCTLARLSAGAALALGDGSRYVGAFRAYGHLVPVWDLAPDTAPEAVEEPAAAFRARLDEALAASGPLTGEQRRARSALVGRQVTLRPGQ